MEREEVLRVIAEAARNKLTELFLADKELTSVPKEIGELKNLTVFYLSGIYPGIN